MNEKRFNLVPGGFLLLSPFFALGFTIYFFKTSQFHWWMAVLFLFFYFATVVSVTAGYHRLWAHKSYDAHPIFRWLLALFGAASFQNSILQWAADHRIHHRFVDKDEDPYCIHKGFWYAHFLWMLHVDKPHPLDKAYRRDLLTDKIVVIQNKYYLPIAIGMGFVLPTAIGWSLGSALGGLVFGALIRVVMVHHVTFLINSACHFWGSQKYTDENTARDNWLLAFFTSGEGYHNFHHFFANDYRNGIRWYHWDPTKWFIRSMSWLGLATKLKTAPEQEILIAQVRMEEKRALTGLKTSAEFLNESLANIRARFETAQQKFFALKKEYQEFKALRQDQYRARIDQLRLDLKAAKAEMKLSLSLWRASLQNARQF